MHLARPNNDRLLTLFNWFDSDRSVAVWGGPDMRLPMTFESMQLDARINTLASWFLINDAGDSVGFGQFYNRAERCHLGRLVIAPEHRGKRLGQALIEELVREGTALNLPEQSLFVLTDNLGAKRLYKRMGFENTTYPGTDLDLTDIDYMVRR